MTRVSTGTGANVSLEFADGSVEVREISAAHQRAARICGGSLVGAFGLAAVGANAGARGIRVLPTVMWILALVVLVAGAGGAGAWLLWSAARKRGSDRVTITAAEVSAARSEVSDGVVTVSVTTVDGQSRSFSAAGHVGSMLATEFGRLVSPEGVPDPGPVEEEHTAL
ncbi:hypothetical protein Ahu01nite_085890 [Winogradskya humida]|uniref:Uncharacterized protein n=1 Tax=Winogradskya humida TaxID=113566 RepID=A0ABQ4A3Q8_9ACTN|nr:hypothetical protein Ahu01nite_085890 [Actinoplanes humidus]